ncbi:repair protein Rad1/Rec1/Rad17-domain-containing protein [Jimgerdemannia flammicorona]|uniref:Repair protein Rad1/Rec1/Rad17-domain-containing protein n=1 Tax=Jimgerdemannia flammicorona TaxID=994334 RepID=A0A433DBT7_9FUNG|nr:repair protein Rad1/Rec1/Rad17-domain-containing protein [Jimgerdemannia flammicorona]
MTQPEANDPVADEDKLFVAKLPNVKPLANLLRAVQFKEKATCHLLPEGLRIVVEDSRCVQATAWLQKELFSQYELRPQDDGNAIEYDHVFMISLTALLECLNIFGNATGAISTSQAAGSGSASAGNGSTVGFARSFTVMKMSYDGPGSALELMLEDSGVITLCKITTFEPEPELDFDFNSTPSVQRVIMKSEWLRDAFNELDSTSDRVTFLISPERPFFRLSSFGVAGSTEMDYPKDTDVLESFYCTAIAQHSYRFSLIQHCLKALNASKKSSIRTNERGFMSMQVRTWDEWRREVCARDYAIIFTYRLSDVSLTINSITSHMQFMIPTTDTLTSFVTFLVRECDAYFEFW